MITLDVLASAGGVRHGFFGRQGGVSDGLYSSLNCGFGSGDDPEKVAENRARAARQVDLTADRVVSCYQIHSPAVVMVEKPWQRGDNPRADAMVTNRRGIGLGILTADCAPVLLADAQAGVIGAAHAGWRGALDGVLEATIKAMADLGAQPERMVAVVGPCIGRASYEVGPEFPTPFLLRDIDNGGFFDFARRPDHFQFDLSGFVASRLAKSGVAQVAEAKRDTAAEAEHFFSYRRACLTGEKDYGRGLSIIALEP